MSELHNGLEMLLSLSKVMLPMSYDRQSTTAVFSQHHHNKTASLCLLYLPPAIFEFAVDAMLRVSILHMQIIYGVQFLLDDNIAHYL